jgi:hypothetical protein
MIDERLHQLWSLATTNLKVALVKRCRSSSHWPHVTGTFCGSGRALMKPMLPAAGSALPALGMFPVDRWGFSAYRTRHSPANIQNSDERGSATKGWPAGLLRYQEGS